MVQISSCGFLPLLIWTSYFRLGQYPYDAYQHPTYIDPAIEEKIRDRFPILLDKAHMKPGNERW
jgi:hypothetical protein